MKKTPVTQEQIGDLPCQNHTKRISKLEQQANIVTEYWPLILLVGLAISVTSTIIISGFKYDGTLAKKTDIKELRQDIQDLSKQIGYLNIRLSAYKTEDSIRKIVLERRIDSLTKIYLAKR